MYKKRYDNRNRVLRFGEQQRKDGRYMYTYTDPVTKKRQSVYSWRLDAHDKMPVGKRPDISLREKEKIIERDLMNGVSIEGGNITVLNLVEQYLNTKRNMRPTTLAGYKTVVNVLKKDRFGSQKINHINTMDAKAWILKLQSEDGKSYSSIHTIRGVVRPAFQMAYEADFIRKNPFDFELNNFLINDSIKREALTPKQERDFLKFIKEDVHFSQFYDGMFILLKTGLRISELCGLTIRDVDLKERTINVHKQLQYTAGKVYIEQTKTNAGTRVLPMSDEVYETFKRVVSGRKKPKVEKMIDGVSGFLFLDDKGKPMVAYQWEKKFQHSVEKYNKIYKVELPKITPHVCRHTYCSNMAKSGISVKTLQYLMGHSDISVTMNVYTHLKLEDAQDELEKLKVREQVKKEMALIDIEYAKRELARVSDV